MTSWDNSRKGPEILIKVLPHGRGLDLPAYATEMAVGMDLAAAVDQDMLLEPGQRGLVPAGFEMAVPPGYEAQVRPRSGLAVNNGIIVPNAPGTIDPDYRGEVKVILLNMGTEPFIIRRGMRVAQMVIVPAVHADVRTVDQLPPTGRGDGGFGSTGTA
ncbi:MAG: dUTP diphosphatase [bacterium]|nr:dUTP diphosphatase [bacterium]